MDDPSPPLLAQISCRRGEKYALSVLMSQSTAYTCSFRGQGIALFAFPKSCLRSPEFSDIANRSDQAQRFAMLVKRGFGALEDSTDLAVRTDDAVLDFELLPREAGSGIGFERPAPIVGMDVLEIFLLGPSPSAGAKSEDTQTFIGPTDVVRREIEHPTSNRGDALSLYQLAVAFSQHSFCPGPFDCLGNQRCRRFQKFDLHFVPNVLAAAIVKAKRAPNHPVDHDRN